MAKIRQVHDIEHLANGVKIVEINVRNGAEATAKGRICMKRLVACCSLATQERFGMVERRWEACGCRGTTEE